MLVQFIDDLSRVPDISSTLLIIHVLFTSDSSVSHVVLPVELSDYHLQNVHFDIDIQQPLTASVDFLPFVANCCWDGIRGCLVARCPMVIIEHTYVYV